MDARRLGTPSRLLPSPSLSVTIYLSSKGGSARRTLEIGRRMYIVDADAAAGLCQHWPR